MNDFASLRILDRFRPVFQKLNIDYDVMRLILQLKLTMDSRRMPAIFSGSNVKKEGNQFLKSLWMYALFGILFLVPFLFLGNEFLFSLTIMFSSLFVILMTSMVSDFSAVLLDIRDKNILHPKPISEKTLNAAKITHIMIYMVLLTGAFVIIPLIVSIFKFGIIFALLFLIEIILISSLAVVLTAFVYLFILRFFSGEMLKDIINYVQIFLAIGMAVSYQLVGRVFQIVNIDISYAFAWWHTLLPPFWFAAPFELILNKDFSFHIIVLSLLALVAPFLAIAVYIRLMPTFERNLSKLQSDTNRRKKKNRKLQFVFAKILCRTKEERTFYKFASLMLKEERELKLKIFPLLGFAVIFPFIFLFNTLSTSSYEEMKSGNSFMVIYFALIMIPSVVQMLEYSGNYKGQWIFYAAPIKNKSIVYSATLKASIMNYFIPILTMLSVIFLWIFSFKIILDLVVVLLATIALTLVSYGIFKKGKFPFTSSHEHTQTNAFFKVFGSMFIVGLMAALHAVVLIIPYGLPVYAFILLISIFIGWKLMFSKG
ncbi:hypothetical protein [Psychrobacillus psychrodurans]|uniref:hypothetical protein n=1 Tax=Psychrobacillus psychrodurans TaxID=126157 RepID=UPI0008EA2A6C|nr:hypothetical protein [Psychrobacillus psychrodurans]MCZ8540186.1 hypothetical protein [Psychrobacillus psychrodurans]SFM48250.1 hypothetical protein SAMN05421832_10327 [Psychrobacillus psychrodurans]